MAVLTSAPPPVQDPISRKRRAQFRKGEEDPLEGFLTQAWLEWFSALSSTIDNTVSMNTSISLSSQTASIAATDISDGALAPGLYKVSWYARITTAASTSSSLTVMIDWTDGGVTPTYTGTAITGNTTTTVQSDTQMIRVDRNAPVRYSTTYASVGATPMEYAITFTLEWVPE